MLKIGDTLPTFQLDNQDGNLVKSSDFKGKKLVVFFYPKANTPGCTAKAGGVATQKIHGQRIHGNRENYLFI